MPEPVRYAYAVQIDLRLEPGFSPGPFELDRIEKKPAGHPATRGRETV